MIETDRTRRTLLQGLVLALGRDQAAWLEWLGRRSRTLGTWLGATSAEAAPAALSDADLDDVVAFAEVVVAGGALSGSERRVIVEHLHEREDQGDQYYLDLYRTAVRFLTNLKGGRFSTLGVDQRVALVERNRLVIGDVRSGEAMSDDVRAIRTRLVPDLIAAYYASSVGWAMVGYSEYPGRCGDLARYTRPEA